MAYKRMMAQVEIAAVNEWHEAMAWRNEARERKCRVDVEYYNGYMRGMKKMAEMLGFEIELDAKGEMVEILRKNDVTL